jgi:hypothetical protein
VGSFTINLRIKFRLNFANATRLDDGSEIGRELQEYEFDEVVALQLVGGWIAVRTAVDALHVLEDRWAEECGPSYSRALAACKAFLEGEGPMLTARVTLCVAAMEAGFPFELYKDQMAFMEAEIASMSEDDLREQAKDHPAF